MDSGLTSHPEATHTRKLLILLASSLAIQLFIASLPSIGDSQIYRLWMRALANEGLAAAYWDKPITSPTGTEAYYYIDYPPVYPYLLYAEGLILKTLTPTLFQTNDRFVVFFIKVPFILANLLICVLLFREAGLRTTGNKALAATAAYAFNPAVLVITCYWGQSDSICGLLLLSAMIALAKKRFEFSFVLCTLAALAKPIAFPFLFLSLFVMKKQIGWGRLVSCALLGVITTVAVFLPFVQIGRLSDIYRTMLFQIDTMPWVSSNAHNLWWMISGGLPWLDANTRIIGFVTYKMIGILFFGIFFIAVLKKYIASNFKEVLFPLCAAISFGLFTLSTHMHAYHLFYALMFMVPMIIDSPRMRTVFLFLTISSFANVLLYDLNFIELSRLGMLLTWLNSQLCVGVFLYWLVLIFRPERAFVSRPYTIYMIAAFLLLTAVPMIHQLLRFPVEHFFFNNWKSAEKKAPGENFIGRSVFMINNDLRPVLFQHPASEISYSMNVPDRCKIHFGISLSPAVWSPEKGDGVLFSISAGDARGSQMLFSSYIDPKSKIADRRWIDYDVDLSEYSGKRIQLTFSTAAGPMNNDLFDWAGWGDPRILCD